MSGIKSVEFSYRRDHDGVNPIEDTANEVYKSGKGLSEHFRSEVIFIGMHNYCLLLLLLLFLILGLTV